MAVLVRAADLLDGQALPQIDGGTPRRFRELRAKILGPDGHVAFRAANVMAPVRRGTRIAAPLTSKRSKPS